MRCLTCYWWDGEEDDEMSTCFGASSRIDGVYAQWPLTYGKDRCPKYTRDIGKTLTAWYWAIRRWWFARGESDED